MSHTSRRSILLVAALAGCFFVGSLAPAAGEAKVSTKDLLQMDKKILESNQEILDELDKTQDLLNQVDVGQVATTLNNLSAKLEQVLSIVGNLSGTLDQVLSVVGNLSGTLDQVLSLVGDLDGTLSQVLGLVNPLTCELLGICPSGSSP